MTRQTDLEHLVQTWAARHTTAPWRPADDFYESLRWRAADMFDTPRAVVTAEAAAPELLKIAGELGIKLGDILASPEGEIAYAAAHAILGPFHPLVPVTVDALKRAAELEAQGQRQRARRVGAFAMAAAIVTVVLLARD